MNNNFRITICRFHTKEKDKLLVAGYFEEDDIGKNKISVQFDGKDVSFEMKEVKRILGGMGSRNGVSLTKDYFIWIELPSNWREGEKLQIINSYQDTERIVFSTFVPMLKKLEKEFPKFVDTGIVNQEGFTIRGWYIDNGHAKMQFFDMSGKEIALNVKRNQRVDVKRAYPENSEGEIIGFEAVYKGKVPKRVRVHFEEEDRVGNYTVKLLMSPLEKGWKKAKQLYTKIKVYYQQFGIKATILRVIDKITGRDSISYERWYKRHCPTEAILKKQREYKFPFQPKISIVIPLYKTPQNYLNELITSIKAQTYTNWELCLSDGSGENSPLKAVLMKYEAEDGRIKVVYNKSALQISENTNAALKIATGDYIAFADHDDVIAPNALYECVYELNTDSSIDMIYTDEDKIDMSGKEHFMPHFKSDFNIDMLRSTNYFCHLVVVKREIFEKVGPLNSEFDGAQDFDFVLRCVEKCSNIKHIPKILYHWRAHKDSTAENPESKDYAFKAGARAVQAHYDRVGLKAKVEETKYKGIYRTKYILQEEPLISIVIPNKDHVDDLEKCISSIEKKSSYKNYEIIVVENNSTENETFEYYKTLEEKYTSVKVIFWKGKGFNYPSINNYGAECAKGEYLLFLNNDTEIVNENCLEELLGYCMRDDVGAVGARLYYEDGTIQHAGVVVGLGGVAGHAFVCCSKEDPGYFGRIQMAQDYSAVTAACILVKRSVFEVVKGFDEKYAVAFNDVDLCMKIRKAGYLIVYNPYAELNHYESKSRGYEDTEEKVQRFNSEVALFESRWGDFLEKGDPYYNPNLTLDKNDFSLNVQANKIRE